MLHVSTTDWDSDERTKDDLCVWASEARSSDEIVIRWQTEYPHNGMFSEETWKERTKYFHYNQLQEAAMFIVNLVKEKFVHEFGGKR